MITATTGRDCAQAAAVAARADVREVHTPEEARLATAVLDDVWGLEDGHSLLDAGLIVALSTSGNYASITSVDGQVVGAAVAFLARSPQLELHSHVVGVRSGMLGRGLGRAIKLDQRAWCLERGMTTMTWTFDPLISRNAYFNLHVLGAAVAGYHVDFYGAMEDRVNQGQPSDRLLASWQLDVEHPRLHEQAIDHQVLRVARDRRPAFTAPPGEARRIGVGVPHDIELLRRLDADLAREWRAALRSVLNELLETGWTIVTFQKLTGYVLERN